MQIKQRPSCLSRTAALWLCLALLVLWGVVATACGDGIPAAAPAPERAAQLGGEPAVMSAVTLSDTKIFPFVGGADWRYDPRWLRTGEDVRIIGRDHTGAWLYIGGGWVAARDMAVDGDVHALEQVLFRGLWLIGAAGDDEPIQVTRLAFWNTWQWDPAGGGIWYGHGEASPPYMGYAPVSRLTISSKGIQRQHSRLRGDVLAAPSGGAVLVRAANEDIWPLGDVYILDQDGAAHHIGRQCDVYFTDSYVPFGRDAAWSPDGRYVVLRDSAEPNDEGRCFIDGTMIYDRNGPVERDLTDPNSPYRQAWYRNPNFGDQVGTDETCADTPPGVPLSERRNRCQWSPDRQWFATMPGAGDNPWLANLLIYRADGTLVRRFLIIGWPCNTFQWSPDSQWLAYGGPSGCA